MFPILRQQYLGHLILRNAEKLTHYFAHSRSSSSISTAWTFNSLKYSSLSFCCSSPLLPANRMVLQMTAAQIHISAPCEGRFKKKVSKKRTKRFLLRSQPQVLDLDFAGDRAEQDTLDLTKPRVDFQQCPSLDNADDVIKRILSLEFGDGKDKLQYRLEEMRGRIQRNPTDLTSLELKIALKTVKIRNMKPHVFQFRHDKVSKGKLYNFIDKRRRWLKFLRLADYERFVWICNELKIKWTPPPLHRPSMIKKAVKRRENELMAFKIKMAKLAQLKREMEKDREDFLSIKDDALGEIERRLAELKMVEEKVEFDYDMAIIETAPHFKPVEHYDWRTKKVL